MTPPPLSFKKTAFLFACLMAPMLAILACSGRGETRPAVPVANVSLDRRAISMRVGGGPVTLIATILPEDATNKNLSWISTNPGVATVRDGAVSALAEGTATILVTSQDTSPGSNGIDTCEVTVIPAGQAVTGVKLNRASLSLSVGGMGALVVTVEPSDAAINDVIWSTSSQAVATVSAGLVRGVAPGTATVTVTTVDGGFKDECAVTVTDVTDVPVTGIELDKTDADDVGIWVGYTVKLNATVFPSNASNKAVDWQSGDARIATVSSDGLVEGINVGSVIIYAITRDSRKIASCSVRVFADGDVSVSGVRLDKKEMELEVGDSGALTATVSPAWAANKDVTWISDAPGVATVADGLVKATGIGRAIIRATAKDGGFTDECLVTVVISSSFDVYVAGIEYTLTKDIATYWKNGSPVPLSEANGEARSIFVQNLNVYVAGWENWAVDTKLVKTATLWVNGSPTRLTDGEYPSQANAVLVSGSDIYVAGWQEWPISSTTPQAFVRYAVLWKNGAPITLNANPESQAEALGLHMHGGDLYIAGHEGRMLFDEDSNMKRVKLATVWINGANSRASYGEVGYPSQANSVFVEAGSIYVAGTDSFTTGGSTELPALWVNNFDSYMLSEAGGDAKSLFVQDGSVYVAGTDDTGTATLWQDDSPSGLSENTSRAYSVYVHGSNVFVAGQENQGATLWVNKGKGIEIAKGCAYSVFVTNR